MRESSTYQAILHEGQRNLLLLMATKKFGPPDASVSQRLEAITDPAKLEHLSGRLLGASSWEEFFAETPLPPPNRNRSPGS